MKPLATHILAAVVGFVTISILIAGVAFIPIFYQCRIAETASCFYEPLLPPAEAFAKAEPKRQK
jgi:hypothetical protein